MSAGGADAFSVADTFSGAGAFSSADAGAAAVLLALAGGLWCAAPRVRGGDERRERDREGGGHVGPLTALARLGRRARQHLPGVHRGVAPSELALVCTQVAGRVRAGAAPADAWRRELAGPRGQRSIGPPRGDRAVPGGAGGTKGQDRRAPEVPDPSAAGRGPDADPDGVPRELSALSGTSPAADAAIVACRISARSGAPLADVLDSCAAAIAEAEAAHAERAQARAGPATTARILGWLPVASLFLGVMVGVDPLTTVLDGGVGSLAILTGLGLTALGRMWTGRLVARASRGEP